MRAALPLVIDEAAHRDEVEAWRRQRYAYLRRETSWLTLAGLDWLERGANRVGSDPTLEVTIPSGPAFAGTITVGDGAIVADGAFLHDGAPAAALQMTTDRDGEPTLLELGPLRLCVIERGDRYAVRTWDTTSELRRTFEGIDHWPVDPAWRLDARFEATPERSIVVPDVIGVSDEEPSPGEVAFEISGETHRLQALAGGDAGDLWLVFGDATNGDETYGGGRFLYTEPPGPDGRLVVDFNRAYNPPCVFTPYATCPLPWPSNRLDVRITAGERLWLAPGAAPHG